MEAFKTKPLTQEEIDEVTSYIEKILELSFEEIDKLAKTSWKHWRYVMLFHQLPKTELHKRFYEKVRVPTNTNNAKDLEWRLIGEMKENKQLFIREHLIDSYQYNDVKYQIVDRYFIGSWETGDEVIQISIPYFSPLAWRDKYGYWITIYRSKTPEFFDRLVANMKVYSGNASLTSNKK